MTPIIRTHKREQIDPRILKTDPANPNKMTDAEEEGLSYSLEKWGDVHPVVIDQNNVIADGEHRVKAFISKGVETIEVIRFTFQTDDERKLFRQTMNKLRGQHDKKMDVDEVYNLIKDNDNQLLEYMRLTGETDEQNVLKYIQDQYPDYHLPSAQFEEKEETVMDLLQKAQAPETPIITQKGDIWQLGEHLLICGDCTDEKTVSNLLDEKTVDLLLTDPPYGVNYSAKNEFLNAFDGGKRVQTDIENDNLEIEDYESFFTNFLQKVPLSDYNIVYIFMSGFALHHLRKALDNCDIKWGDYLVWVKNNHVLGRKDYNSRHEFVVYGWKNHHKFYGDFSTTVLEFDKPVSSKLHPVMKPLDLLRKLIIDGSQKDMIVYDPFLGSGSTLIACEQTKRKCYGVELDPKYCDVIILRWINLTGKAPVRVRDNKKWEDISAPPPASSSPSPQKEEQEKEKENDKSNHTENKKEDDVS